VVETPQTRAQSLFHGVQTVQNLHDLKCTFALREGRPKVLDAERLGPEG
jgi:hypothetical protein